MSEEIGCNSKLNFLIVLSLSLINIQSHKDKKKKNPNTVQTFFFCIKVYLKVQMRWKDIKHVKSKCLKKLFKQFNVMVDAFFFSGVYNFFLVLKSKGWPTKDFHDKVKLDLEIFEPSKGASSRDILFCKYFTDKKKVWNFSNNKQREEVRLYAYSRDLPKKYILLWKKIESEFEIWKFVYMYVKKIQ